MKFKELRYCVICAPKKLPPKLREGSRRRILHQGEFVVPTTSIRKTCSAECSLKFKRQKHRNNKQTKEEIKEKAKKHQKKQYLKRKQKKPKTTKKCVTCGHEFIRRNKTHKNCSHKCSVKYYIQYHQIPGVKAKAKAKRQDPKVKAQMKKYSDEYRRRPENKEKERLRQKKYNQDPKYREKLKLYYLKNREIIKKQKKERYHENKEKRKAYLHKLNHKKNPKSKKKKLQETK